MGLFNKKSKEGSSEAVDEEVVQPAAPQGRTGRGLLRRRSKGDRQDGVEDLSPEADAGSQSKSKGWLSRKSKDEALPPPPPQPTTADQAAPLPKKSTKRSWIGRKPKNGASEDDTALSQADIVQEAPKPPPRVRTPEEIAAGLERQKAAVNAVRNTPEKRAATRAAAPVEIPPATTSNAYSTAPVDRSGANRASMDRSGGKFKGMFKGKGPSMPGFKSKRSPASPADNAVVSSAPVEVVPEGDGANSASDSLGNGGNSTTLAPDNKKGGKFRGMFKRGSGKSKTASAVKELPSKSAAVAGGPREVELSDQAELGNEPVFDGGSDASYSEPAAPQRHMPQQSHQQLPTGYSGITTQEYAPVLPNTAHAMGHNQLETTKYAPVQSPAQEAPGYQATGTYNQSGRMDRSNFNELEGNDFYPDGASAYNQGRGTEQLRLSEREGNNYPKGSTSYNHQSYHPQSVGHSNGYPHQGHYGHDEEEDGAGQLDSGDWERVNRAWNRA